MSISEVLRERVLDPLPLLSEPLWPVDPEIFRKRCRIHGLGELPHSPANPLPLGLPRSGWRDLNSRPLGAQIGPPLSSVNHISLVSMYDH
jgi:hypothetical protein